MPFATSAGARIYFEWRSRPEDHPGVRPVLFLRGLSRTLRFWLGLADRFAARWPLLLLDNRGIGRSLDDGKPFSMATLADDVAAVLDAAGVEAAHVFGISLGGMIAQELALRHPARVDRLVLGATTPGPAHGHAPPLAAVATLLVANALPRRLAGALVLPLVLARLPRAEQALVGEAWDRLARLEPPSRWTVVRQLLAARRHDTWERLPSVTAPTLCLVGAADRLIPGANTRLLAERIPGARYVELAGCGHDFPADDEAGTFAAIDGFLRG
jgi:pimeloyl-ACP methyl ester carboxylesterase